MATSGFTWAYLRNGTNRSHTQHFDFYQIGDLVWPWTVIMPYLLCHYALLCVICYTPDPHWVRGVLKNPIARFQGHRGLTFGFSSTTTTAFQHCFLFTCFSDAASGVWNSVDFNTRSAETFLTFKCKLTTELFRKCYDTWTLRRHRCAPDSHATDKLARYKFGC